MKNVNEIKAKRARAGEDISDRISHFRSEVEDAAHEAGRTIKGIYDEKRTELNEFADEYSAAVRRHPIQISLAAVAVGYLIGRLSR